MYKKHENKDVTNIVYIQGLNIIIDLYFKIDIYSVGFGSKEIQRVAVTNRSFIQLPKNKVQTEK